MTRTGPAGTRDLRYTITGVPAAAASTLEELNQACWAGIGTVTAADVSDRTTLTVTVRYPADIDERTVRSALATLSRLAGNVDATVTVDDRPPGRR